MRNLEENFEINLVCIIEISETVTSQCLSVISLNDCYWIRKRSLNQVLALCPCAVSQQ